VLAARLPPALAVHRLDERTSRVDVGSDTPQLLAVHLAMLGVDFRLEDPDAHPQLVHHLRILSERFGRAVEAVPEDS
jgi:hypothetical protein